MADTAPWGALEGDKADPNYGRVCGRCGGAIRQGMRHAHVCMTQHPEAVSMRLLAMAVADMPIREGLWEAGNDPWHRPVVLAPSNSGGDVILVWADVPALATYIAHAACPGRMTAWLGCAARLRERVAEGHTGECRNERLRASVLAWATPPCTCGHEDDLAALGAVDAEG